jgi:hypothetical protein
VTSSIVEFWRRCSAPIHPEDEPILDALGNTGFVRSGPPAPYLGDVDKARVLILFANAGYRKGITEREFPTQAEIDTYFDRLHRSLAGDPRDFGDYWRGRIPDWIAHGQACVVNACAYRSRNISNEADNQRICDLLPSVYVHRRWLMSEVLPLAKVGKRLVIVHRWGLWRLQPGDGAVLGPNFVFSRSARMRYLANNLVRQVDAWLRDNGGSGPPLEISAV